MKMRPHLLVFCLFLTIFVLSGCLGSRSRVQEDESNTTTQGYTQEAVDDLKAEISRLTAKVEELEVKQNSLPVIEKIEDRITKLEEKQLEFQENIQKIKEDLPPPDPIVYFKKGKSAFDKDDHAAAVQFLTKYLETTKSGDGKTAQEAQFYIGESQYLQKNFKKAILAYDSVLRKFKHKRFQSKSLYKIALCFDSLGKEDEADAFYKELIQKYPKSREAKSARRNVKKPAKSSKNSKK